LLGGFGRALGIQLLHLLGQLGLALGGLLGLGLGLRRIGLACGLFGQLALLSGQFGPLGAGFGASRHLVGQLAQAPGRLPLGLPLFFGLGGLLGAGQGFQGLLFLRGSLVAGAHFLRFLGDLLLPLLRFGRSGLRGLLLRPAFGLGGDLRLSLCQSF